jgi:hypothetical protein
VQLTTDDEGIFVTLSPPRGEGGRRPGEGVSRAAAVLPSPLSSPLTPDPPSPLTPLPVGARGTGEGNQARRTAEGVGSEGEALSRRLDWRGWLALAWVVYWGWAYAVMATKARWPLVSAWLHSFRSHLGF